MLKAEDKQAIIDYDQFNYDESSTKPNQYTDLRGEIAGSLARSGAQPSADKDFDTLDEPILETVKRDLYAVGRKFGHVFFPKRSDTLLKEWDLWGPLFLCVFISLLLQSDDDNGRGPQFTEVFALTFFGACLVTANVKLLGGQISFFQSLCVLGYCLLSPAIALLLCRLIVVLFPQQTTTTFFIRLAVTVFGFCWATFASHAFLAGYYPQRRRALAMYPIFLFYFVISWLVVSHTHYGH